MEDGDGRQVCSTGGEGFAVPTGQMHLENGYKNDHIEE
jgi:hypothetical protein